MQRTLLRGIAVSATVVAVCVGAGPPVNASAPHARRGTPAPAPAGQSGRLSRFPLVFVENRGQTDADVVAYVRGRGTTVFFTPGGVTYSLSSGGKHWTVKADFAGADAGARPELHDQAPTTLSWFSGPKVQWKTGVRTFREVTYRDLWPGIDAVYSAPHDRLKCAFVVHPGADPSRIRIAYRGADDVAVGADGALAISTPVAALRDEKPFSYQDVDGLRTEISSAYDLGESTSADGRVCGFRIGSYDESRPLVVDPAVIVYAGYIGGDGNDVGTGVAVDADGAAYVAGYTESSQPTFPRIAGPNLTQSGLKDAFVAKIRPDGTTFDYVGYIGGDEDDMALGIAIDSQKNAYLTGITQSSAASFPLLFGPDLTLSSSGPDAWAAKVNPTGTALVYCGYIGGTNQDQGNGIAVDKDGNAYVVGFTRSTPSSFPLKSGPVLTKNADDLVGFVVKIKADGSDFAYAGYVAGSGNGDDARGVAVDADGAAYVVGVATSNNFPAVVGPDLTIDGTDAFIAKVRPDGTGFVYSGFIGGSGGDEARAVALDADKNAYVTGITGSSEATFPVLVGPDLVLATNFNPFSKADAFVAKVKADGTGLDYCGYIGGKKDDLGAGIAVNAAGEAWVTGWTFSDQASFPVVGGPGLTMHTRFGLEDAFVAHVSATGASLISCGYIGGDTQELGAAIAVDATGAVYMTGSAESDEATFPVRAGPDVVHGAGFNKDAFVVKIAGSAAPVTSYFLPKRVKASANTKDPAKSVLFATGFIDTGPGVVNFTQPATLVVGGFTFPIPSLVAHGASFTHTAAGISFSITPNKAGSSRAQFKLTTTADLTGKIDLNGSLALRFTQGALDGKGSVALKNGHFGLGTLPGRGALVEPNLYLLSANAQLKGAGKDTLSLVVGLATNGVTPPAAPAVRIVFGDAFGASIPSFTRKGDKYVFTGNASGITTVTLDYARETLTVRGKAMTLGILAQGGNSVLVDIAVGAGEHAVRVRMALKGTALKY